MNRWVMSNLLKEPDDLVTAFIKGACAIGIPATVAFFIRIPLMAPDRLLEALAFAGVLSMIAVLIGGGLFALWAVITRWAYREVSTKDDAW